MPGATITSLPVTRHRRFLVVEDEADLARLIGLHLQDLQAQITHIDRGDLALERAIQERWDLIILDLRLPGLDGLDVCRELRNRGIDTPIMMLTARATELDRVLGLELGADDYLAKPFSSLELAARAKALLRRSEKKTAPVSEQNQRRIKNLRIDKIQRTVSNQTQPIELTAREFDLLWFFACNPGRVFSRTELLDKVWGYGYEGYEHTVNSHINRLRAKIETDPSAPELLLTVWGIGYKFYEETKSIELPS